MKSNLYVVRRPDGLIKVGISRNVDLRLKAISRSHGLLSVIKVVAGGRKEETEIHAAMSKWQQFGEWFSPSSEVLAIVAEIADAPPVPDQPAKVADDEIEGPFVGKGKAYVRSCLQARTMRLGAANLTQRLFEIADDYGFSPHSLVNLHKKKVRSIPAGFLDQLRAAAMAEQELALESLRQELAAEEAYQWMK